MFDTILDIIKDFIEGASEEFTGFENIADELFDVLIDAGIDVSHLSHEDLQRLVDEVLGGQDSHISATSSTISFTGLGLTSHLADLQCGPTCGFEAIENLIQLNNTGYNNSLSDYLQHAEFFDGGSIPVDGGLSLNPQHYQHILNDFGINADWHAFSHDLLIDLITKNRGILAVGDAHYLDSVSYPQMNSHHAFVITDAVHDDFGNVIGYKGLDSNFSGQEVEWSPQQIEGALQHSLLKECLLISGKEMNWPYKTT